MEASQNRKCAIFRSCIGIFSNLFKFPCFSSFSKNYFVRPTSRPVKIFRARPPWLPPLCFSRPRVAYVATCTRRAGGVVCAFSAIAGGSPTAKPLVQAREPTNYFRVYKINEKSVVDRRRVRSLSLSLSRRPAFTRERTHTVSYPVYAIGE